MTLETGQLARIDVLLEALGRRGARLHIDEEDILFRARIEETAVRMAVDEEHLVIHILEDGNGPEEWRLSLRALAETAIRLRRPSQLREEEESGE